MAKRGGSVGAAQNATSRLRTVAMAVLRTSAFLESRNFRTRAVTTSEAAVVRRWSGTDRSIMSVASGEKRARGVVPTMASEGETPVATSDVAVSGSILGPDMDRRVASAALELYLKEQTGHSVLSLLEGGARLGPRDMAILRNLFDNRQPTADPPPKTVVGVTAGSAFVRGPTGAVTHLSGDPKTEAGAILAAMPGASGATALPSPQRLTVATGVGADTCKSPHELRALIVSNTALLRAAEEGAPRVVEPAAKRRRKKSRKE